MTRSVPHEAVYALASGGTKRPVETAARAVPATPLKHRDNSNLPQPRPRSSPPPTLVATEKGEQAMIPESNQQHQQQQHPPSKKRAGNTIKRTQIAPETGEEAVPASTNTATSAATATTAAAVTASDGHVSSSPITNSLRDVLRKGRRISHGSIVPETAGMFTTSGETQGDGAAGIVGSGKRAAGAIEGEINTSKAGDSGTHASPTTLILTATPTKQLPAIERGLRASRIFPAQDVKAVKKGLHITDKSENPSMETPTAPSPSLSPSAAAVAVEGEAVWQADAHKPPPSLSGGKYRRVYPVMSSPLIQGETSGKSLSAAIDDVDSTSMAGAITERHQKSRSPPPARNLDLSPSPSLTDSSRSLPKLDLVELGLRTPPSIPSLSSVPSPAKQHQQQQLISKLDGGTGQNSDHDQVGESMFVR